jgi:CcmD family protein
MVAAMELNEADILHICIGIAIILAAVCVWLLIVVYIARLFRKRPKPPIEIKPVPEWLVMWKAPPQETGHES